MRKAQYVLGGGPARRCKISYIIEGEASKRTVHGGNVGRRNWQQTVEDVEQAIAGLGAKGFSVMKSKGHLDTVGLLAKVAEDVSWDHKNGTSDAIFTYQQFLSRVKVLADKIGDPPTDPEHMNPAPPVVRGTDIPEASTTAYEADPFESQPDPFDSRPDSVKVKDDDAQPKNPYKKKAASKQSSEAEGSAEYIQLKKLSIAQLKEKCKERDEKVGGKKDELIARLLKPRKPEILIMRAR